MITKLRQTALEVGKIIHKAGFHFAIVITDGKGKTISHICDEAVSVAIPAIIQAIEGNKKQDENAEMN